MTSETPSGPTSQDRPTEPFTKGRIVWGRPPQTVFRVGPLPRAASPAFINRPVRGPGSGVLTGSMLPPTRRGEPDTMGVEAVAVADSEPGHDPLEPIPELPEPEVEIEPVLVEDADPDRVAAPVPPRETVVEVEAAEPLETVAPLRSEAAAPTAAPRSVPSVVVTPAIYATVTAALESVPKKDRWIVLVAVLAVVVTGGFIWLATLPNDGSPAFDPNAPPPAAAAPTPGEPEAPIRTQPQPLE